MSGKHLWEKLALDNNISEALAKKLLSETFCEIERIVAKTGRCQIRGFGTFKIKTYAARRTHDFQTRTIMELPQKRKLVFEHGRDRKLLTDSVEKSQKILRKPLSGAALAGLLKK